jgi:tRNA pseudouridine55 synthase
MHHGLLLLDKQPGSTSHDAVQQARRLLRQKKVGHCGTLDPDATGLLLLTFGRATRLTRFLINAPKVYEGSIRFGVATDTYDASGTPTAASPVTDLAQPAIEAAMQSLTGTYLQTPPPYCAKKVGGVKYYELARRGEEVPLEPKEVTVYEFAATAPLADRMLPFRMSCASGTYARTLAHDLGQRLGCGAHLAALRRLRIGPFDLEAAVTTEEIARRGAVAPDELDRAWIPFDDIPLPFGELTADAQQERRLANGQTVLVRDLEGEEGDWVKLVNSRHQLIAVGSVVERIGQGQVGVVQPRIVFS